VTIRYLGATGPVIGSGPIDALGNWTVDVLSPFPLADGALVFASSTGGGTDRTTVRAK
jgi:hypothetical protein